MSSPTGCSYIIFTRVPIPGKVKTRLMPRLTEDECAQLQDAMVLDLTEKLADLGNSLMLCYSDEWKDIENGEALRDRFVSKVCSTCSEKCEMYVFPQEGNDLGTRMANAVEKALGNGSKSCLLMGSDHPYIRREDVCEAEEALANADVVFGPSKDGGFWLVGLKKPFPELFEKKFYGEGPVLEQAIASCRAHGRTFALACESSDIDIPDDYDSLCNRVNSGDVRVGPRTALHAKQMKTA